jgi:hypothetical protein
MKFMVFYSRTKVQIDNRRSIVKNVVSSQIGVCIVSDVAVWFNVDHDLTNTFQIKVTNSLTPQKAGVDHLDCSGDSVHPSLKI